MTNYFPHERLKADDLNAAFATIEAEIDAETAARIASDQTIAASRYARLQAQWVLGSVIANGTFYFVYDAPYDGVINSLTHFCGTGSFTVAVKIGGIDVMGMSAIAPVPTPAKVTTTGANVFSKGQTISGVITGATGSPTNALLSLDVTWAG